MFNKFITYIGIALAVAAFFHEKVSTFYLFVIIFLSLLACIILEKVFKIISNCNYKWIDSIFFLFEKNQNDFRIKDKIVSFTIKSDKEAKYTVKADVIQTKKNKDNVIYDGRYHWPQEKDIIHEVKINNKKVTEDQFIVGQDIKWSTIKIFANDIVHKNDSNIIEYTLDDLYINNLKYHKFLSCKIIEKIDNLQLNFTIPENIAKDATAEYIIQNSRGDVIFSESLKPTNNKNKYSKTVTKPRIGRKYIIRVN